MRYRSQDRLIVHDSSFSVAVGCQRIDCISRLQHPEQFLSKRKLHQAEKVQLVREKRDSATQTFGFSSRPFVLCGLPVKRPAAGCLLHERRNGSFLLQITGHPTYGLPWGQDRLVPLFLATLAVRQQKQIITFRSAAEMLDTFGLPQGGSQYRRLIASFQRVFGATIFFGTDAQRDKAVVLDQVRFHFLQEARLWYSPDLDRPQPLEEGQNRIVLSNEFYREILSHPIPADLEAAKALSSAPAALDLFLWLSYRCFVAKGPERIPLFGTFGLVAQLGSAEYARPRKFRERLEHWLELVRALWPGCPARISSDGQYLSLQSAVALAATKA